MLLCPGPSLLRDIVIRSYSLLLLFTITNWNNNPESSNFKIIAIQILFPIPTCIFSSTTKNRRREIRWIKCSTLSLLHDDVHCFIISWSTLRYHPGSGDYQCVMMKLCFPSDARNCPSSAIISEMWSVKLRLLRVYCCVREEYRESSSHCPVRCSTSLPDTSVDTQHTTRDKCAFIQRNFDPMPPPPYFATVLILFWLDRSGLMKLKYIASAW